MSKRLSSLFALALAGCSLAPDYLRPQAPVPVVWPSNATGGERGVAIAAGAVRADGNWRIFFTDPRLQGLILAALEHNRDLRVAVARVDEARALAGMVRAERFPTMNLAAQRAAALQLPPHVALADSECLHQHQNQNRDQNQSLQPECTR